METTKNIGCPFCGIEQCKIIREGKYSITLLDNYPVSKGHSLIIPKRHIECWFDLEQHEQMEIIGGVEQRKFDLDRMFRPHGYNIGVNCGEAAGQTIFHAHVHIIPRYFGDVVNPRGGVRCVIPNKSSYVEKDKQMECKKYV